MRLSRVSDDTTIHQSTAPLVSRGKTSRVISYRPYVSSKGALRHLRQPNPLLLVGPQLAARPYMACRYCGLPTDGGANHGATRECVDALAAETKRLVDKLGTTMRLPKPKVNDASLDVDPKAPGGLVQNPSYPQS